MIRSPFFPIQELNPHFQEDYNYSLQPRRIQNTIEPYLDDPRILAILGLRRTGKTFLLKSIINTLIQQGVDRDHIFFFSFDQYSSYKGDALRDALEHFLAEYHGTNLTTLSQDKKIYCFFDEVQKVPYCNANLKLLYDTHPNLKFILSGSSSYNIRPDQRETLAGRIIDFHMEPLTWQEYLELHDEKPLPDSDCIAQLLSDGKLPSHHRMYQRPLSMYLDYLHNRDIIEALTITDPNYIPQSVLPKILDRELIIDATGRDDVHFSAIAKRLLQKNANEINLHTIASEEQTSIYQIKKALELGKKLFFWDLLEGKQKVKLYTTSTTLSHHARTSFSPTIDNDGLLFENKIFQRLRKITKNIHYYRKNNQELDFILNETVGIECKLGNLGNYKKYITIAEKENLKQLLIIGQEEIRLIQHENLKIWILPWWIV